MIKVTSFFFEKSEDRKLYREGSIIRHFTEEQEEYRINNGQAVRIETEKKEVKSKPRRKKREKK